MATMIITGCSTGLGAALAVMAAKDGYDVYATMRNLDKRAHLDELAAAAGVSLNVHYLDVQDGASIQTVVDTAVKETGSVDVLVNNAGMGFIRSTEQADEADVQKVFDINVHGVIRCTSAVLPHMRGQKSGRVINISSVGGLVGQPFNEIYCASKFAVEGYTEGLACYVGPHFGIHFTSVEPGGIQTEFANNVLAHLGQTVGILEDDYKPILDQYLGTMRSRQGGDTPYQSADEVAAVIMDCAKNPEPPVRMRTSKWSEDLCELKTASDPDGKKLQAKVRAQFLGV